ncbi:MAG: ComF family protein [Pseudomonadota bacterium]
MAKSQVRKALTETFIGVGQSVFDVILPPRCLACSVIVADRGGLCADCFKKMPFITQPRCEKTGTPLAYDIGAFTDAIEGSEIDQPYMRLRAATRYEGTAKRLAIAFKFHDQPELAERLARFMMNTGRDLIADCDMIVPVPLHRRRLFLRRYNQAAELSKRVAALGNRPVMLDTLQRIRPTKPQVKLDQRARRKNVEGAFVVSENGRSAISGRKVLLIDDVVTTGATINACAETLLRENAQSVDVLAFAKVVDDDSMPL